MQSKYVGSIDEKSSRYNKTSAQTFSPLSSMKWLCAKSLLFSLPSTPLGAKKRKFLSTREKGKKSSGTPIFCRFVSGKFNEELFLLFPSFFIEYSSPPKYLRSLCSFQLTSTWKIIHPLAKSLFRSVSLQTFEGSEKLLSLSLVLVSVSTGESLTQFFFLLSKMLNPSQENPYCTVWNKRTNASVRYPFLSLACKSSPPTKKYTTGFSFITRLKGRKILREGGGNRAWSGGF